MSTSGTQEQRLVGYEAPAETTPARDDCLNCGAALTDAYCGSCGQPRPNTDLTLRELLRETMQELTQLDGKVPRTLHALLTSVAWRRALPRYPAHLYLSLHLHAAWFAALTLATLATAFTATPKLLLIPVAASLAYVVWHTVAAFRRVFRDSWPRTLLKAAGVGAIYACFLGATSLLMLGIAIATM